MENKIDHFFKDKIEDHSLPPSPEVWEKVEANLSKKNNVAVWRIAAAVLITGALVSLVVWSEKGAIRNKPSTVADYSSKDNSIGKKDSSLVSSGGVKSLPKKSSVVPAVAHKNHGTQKNNKSAATEPVLIEKKLQEESVSVVEKNISEDNIKQDATQPTTVASTKQKPIKLEFTLEDYSSEQQVATASEEKSSGFKKVWNLAREVKNGDGPVREIKNELFAHNFKKNKNQ